MHNLTMSETMACVDDVGRIRCPTCGRFSRLVDIRGGNVARGPGFVAHFAPTCVRCDPPVETPTTTGLLQFTPQSMERLADEYDESTPQE